MSLRAIVVAAVLAIVILGYVAWRQNTEKAIPDTPAGQGQMPAPDAAGETPMIADQPGDPGVTWKTPRGWMTQITGGIRVATYIVPGSDRGADAECAVYYFGPGKGGGVEPNVQRWIGEFSKLEKHDLSTRETGGIKIHVVEVKGTYASHGMQPGEAAASHENWTLLGAIAEGPGGDVFFKLTGPAATVGGAKKDFDAMLASMKKK
jgi:hypothetical protein